MDPALLILAVLAGLLILVIIVLLARRARNERTAERLVSELQALKGELLSGQADSFLSLRQSLDTAQQGMAQQITAGQRVVQDKLTLFGTLERRLGELGERAARLETLSDQLSGLSDLLRPPKLRGQLGELWLEQLLEQVLPPSGYQIQHTFRDGKTVDAVVRIGEQLLPVDAKFPLEAFRRREETEGADRETAEKEFQRAFRKHVDDIATKYLRPHEQTTPFAVMYIPAEAVFAAFVRDDSGSLLTAALERQVVPSSPGHFYGFLASLMAVNRQTAVFASDLADESRRLLDSLREIREVVSTHDSLQNKIEGSLRRLGSYVERSREASSRLLTLVERMERGEEDGNRSKTDTN